MYIVLWTVHLMKSSIDTVLLSNDNSNREYILGIATRLNFPTVPINSMSKKFKKENEVKERVELKTIGRNERELIGSSKVVINWLKQ